jgi:hypothetical protein
MIYLQKDTASNDIFLTLYEWKKDVSFTNYLFKLVHQTSYKEYFFVGNVITDNERYTKINVATNLDGTDSILLNESGYLYYYVYAQDSDTNLDPANAIQEIERGIVSVPSGDTYYTPNSTPIDDTVYYG